MNSKLRRQPFWKDKSRTALDGCRVKKKNMAVKVSSAQKENRREGQFAFFTAPKPIENKKAPLWALFCCYLLFYRESQRIGLVKFGLTVYIAYVHIAACQHMAQIVPFEVACKICIVSKGVFKAAALGRHQKDR